MIFTAAPLSYLQQIRRCLARWIFVLGLAGVLLAASPSLLRAGSLDALDRDSGTPEARLGASLKSFQGLELVEDTGRWLTYKVPGNKLRYAGNEVTSIKYNFFKEQLYSIDVTFDSKNTCKRLLKMFEQNYGTNHSFESRRMADTDTELETREWTGAKTYLVLKSAADQRGGVAIFVDRPVWDKLAEPRQERATQLKKMLDGSYINGDF